VTDEEPRPVFPTVGAKAPTAKGYRASDYSGTLKRFMDSGEPSALVSCEAIEEHAVYMGLSRAIEDRRLPAAVSKRPDGVYLTRTGPDVSAPSPEPTDEEAEPVTIEPEPETGETPEPESPSLLRTLKAWVGRK
jgi:hypothetical protein